MHRRFPAGAQWLAFLVFALCLPTSKAQAHAKIVSSSPANGEKLKISPERIRLVFSEKPTIALSRVVITGPDSKELTLAIQADSSDAKALYALTPPLSAGAYTVSWRVVPSDGHPVAGTLTFEVEGSLPAIAPVTPPPPPAPLAAPEPEIAGAAMIPAFLRGAALSALLALCGLLGFTAYGERGESKRQKKLTRWLSASAAVLLLVHLAAWLVHLSPVSSLDGPFIAATLTSRLGADELVRVLFSALAAWAVILAKKPKLAFAFALAAVIAGGTMGHPAALQPIIAIPVKAFHLVGVAFWMGGIIWLLTNDTDSLEAASTVSSVAIVSISIVAITGIVETILFLNEPTDLVTSLYGLTVLAKVAGLFALAAFGSYHRSMIRKQSVDSSFRASLRRETIIMVAVVMIAGFLAYVPTPVPR